jgi:hypothetical protein
LLKKKKKKMRKKEKKKIFVRKQLNKPLFKL